MFENRTYRALQRARDLIYCRVSYGSANLSVGACKDLTREAAELLKQEYTAVEKEIKKNPGFLTALTPVEASINASKTVKEMCAAAKKVGVGPMAAVAGAIAEKVASGLLVYSTEMVVENGGDIYLIGEQDRIVMIYAGNSPFTGKIGLKIKSEQLPCSVCTSSGTVGHSLNFGRADAAVIISKSGALADAAATALGNMVKSSKDLDHAIGSIIKTDDVLGAVCIIGDKIAAAGLIELVQI